MNWAPPGLARPMESASPTLRNRTGGRRAFRSSGGGRRRSRGVSDVIATIIILGITVTLFASLFAFVDSFPAPPSQSVNTFETSLSYTTQAGKTYISTISVEMTAGPSVPGIADVFLSSENNPSLPAFAAPITVGYGIHNQSSWVVGQTWVYSFAAASRDLMPDNITISIVSAGLLLYSVVVPGNVLAFPPSIIGSGVTPDPVAAGAAFEIYAVFSGNLTGATATINVGGISSNLPNTPQSMAGGNGVYYYNVSSGKTSGVASGTYYAFLSLTNGQGQQVSGSVSITISSSSSGSGSSSSLSVTVGMSPQPPTLPQQSPSAYFWASVTYTGSKTNVPVSVNFTVSQTPGGRTSTTIVSNLIPGQTGLTITGPSTLTVYSQTAYDFNSWLLNTSVTITANATLGQSVGSATGTISFQTQNLAATSVYVTTSGSGALPAEHTFSHTCTPTTNCPYLYVEVWNNYTTALGGPADLYFSGTEYTNSTAHSYTETVASTAVAEGGDTLVNLAGGTTRWSQVGYAGTYLLTVVLTLKTSATGTIVGYVDDTFSLTVT